MVCGKFHSSSFKTPALIFVSRFGNPYAAMELGNKNLTALLYFSARYAAIINNCIVPSTLIRCASSVATSALDESEAAK